MNGCLFYFVFLRSQSIKEAKERQTGSKFVLSYNWFESIFEKDGIRLMGMINAQRVLCLIYESILFLILKGSKWALNWCYTLAKIWLL